MVSSARTVTFPGPVSPGLTLFPLRRGPGDPCFPGRRRRRDLADQPDAQRVRHGAHQPRRARCRRLHGVGQRCRGIRRRPAGDAGRRRRLVGFRARRPDVAAAHRRVPHLRLGRTDQVLEALIPAVLEQRVPGADALPRLAAAGDQVRDAGAGTRAGADAGAAVGRGVAAHPVVGVSPRQRRSGTGPHHRRLRAAGVVAGAAGVVAGREGPRGADVAARSRDVDRGRDGAACLRRRRRAVGRRLPHLQDDRLDAAGPPDRRRRAWSSCSSRCARTATGWSGCWKPAGWPTSRAAGARLPVQDIRAL